MSDGRLYQAASTGQFSPHAWLPVGRVRRNRCRGVANALPWPAMAEQTPPYWVLISVLFSSQPLTPSLAMTLHQAAYDLYRRDQGAGQVLGDLVSGTVRNLRKDVLMGTIGGPAFEAEVETERGSGTVRFILTRQGLEMMQAQEAQKPPRPRYLN